MLHNQIITQGTTIKQTTYIKMTSHLDRSRTVCFTTISTFKQYARFTCIDSTTYANSIINQWIITSGYSRQTIFRKGLTFNKTGVSSNIRKLTSAKDYRVTSQTIRTAAIIIMTVVEVLIFLSEIGIGAYTCASKCLKKHSNKTLLA